MVQRELRARPAFGDLARVLVLALALVFGLLTPFYFIRAGSFVSVPALVGAPLAFAVLLGSKMITKFVGVFPMTLLFKSPRRESMYTTLLMSTGLTFGTISSLFGLSHHIITQAQYSLLVAAVIGSAVVPTLIANAFYMPRHLLPAVDIEGELEPARAPDPAAVTARSTRGAPEDR